jgi:hypothetical protein
LVRGRDWGKVLLRLGLDQFKNTCAGIPCRGRVKSENLPSRRCFQKLQMNEIPDGGGAGFSLAVLSDPDSWINHYIPDLLIDWMLQGHPVLWVHHPEELPPGDFCFLLGCGQLIPQSVRNQFRHNLVVHESNLPSGKGWSPLTWQILEGKNEICVTLLEAEEKVDSGCIYGQECIYFQGNELVEELRQKQAKTTIRLCKKFVNEYPEVVTHARNQKGKESYYPRKNPNDSRLDPDKSIREQFNLLRVVDNERYPAFFELQEEKYVLKIEKQ